MTKVYTLKDLAQLASERGRPVTVGYIRRLCRDRHLPGAYKIARDWLVPPGQAEQWLAEWIKSE